MKGLEITVPRRQAILIIRGEPHYEGNGVFACGEVARVPVLVWPMPNEHGYFIVEHTDGRCEDVPACDLTFLDSKELFDQYDWSE